MAEAHAVMAAHEAIDGVLDRVGKHAYEKYL